MGSRYLTWLADELRAAGLTVIEYDGWQTRARSSGGFEPGRPWLVMWHHTASQASPENDAAYCAEGADTAPVCNVIVNRDGSVTVIAAAATNTNGSGIPITVSRGTVPEDQMNTHAFGMEIANSGVGEPYSEAQIDAAFTVSDVVNLMCGNAPDDVCTHAVYAPDRKIDPARAAAVLGGWRPDGYSSADTWVLEDVEDEATRRAQPVPTPDPEDGDMIRVDYGYPGTDPWWTRMLIGGVGITWIQGHANDDLDQLVPAHLQIANDRHMLDVLASFRAIGPPPSTWTGNPALEDAWRVSSLK